MNRNDTRVRGPGARGAMSEKVGIDDKRWFHAGKKGSPLGKFGVGYFLRLHHVIAVFATRNVMMVRCFNDAGRDDNSIGIDNCNRFNRWIIDLKRGDIFA